LKKKGAEWRGGRKKKKRCQILERKEVGKKGESSRPSSTRSGVGVVRKNEHRAKNAPSADQNGGGHLGGARIEKRSKKKEGVLKIANPTRESTSRGRGSVYLLAAWGGLFYYS